MLVISPLGVFATHALKGEITKSAPGKIHPNPEELKINFRRLFQ